MKGLRTSAVAAWLVIMTSAVVSQNLTQTVRGTVIDYDSRKPLIGATVVVTGIDPLKGTVTDIQGNFKLEQVPVGRHTLKITYMGYEEMTIPEIPVGSAKEVILTIELTEALTPLEEVVISAGMDKGKPLNEMTTVSARSFTVEETRRYPMSISDPSRMALSFAGTATTSDETNEIIIRGNSPKGLLWRLEGSEIPGPNHFAEEGSSAGAISILSSNLITSSDFMTGAFPAEYGNAISGVFDISLRNGNTETREYSFQFGVLGTDLSLEGPFKKGYKGSYLANYRYSTLALFHLAGIKLAGDQIPQFQDLSFNLHLPSPIGEFNVWCIGGLSNSTLEAKRDSLEWTYQSDRMDDVTKSGMFAAGVTHLFFPNQRSYLRTVLSFSGSGNLDEVKLLDTAYVAQPFEKQDALSDAVRISTLYNIKFNPRFTLRTGMIASRLHFSYLKEGTDEADGKWKRFIDSKGHTYLYQAYLQTRYRFNEELSMNTGIHFMLFGLTKKFSIEPRIGLKWDVTSRQSLGIGLGLHSRHEPLFTYFTQVWDSTLHEYIFPDKKLDLMKALHLVVSYELIFREDFHMKTEAYYQYLFDVPVSQKPDEAVSTINGDVGLDTLVNSGKGKNYGIEFTLEKYFTHQYYFLVTSSIFRSQFRASDDHWYHTRYDIGFINNLIGGKEFYIGKGKNNILGANAKLIWAGGTRYTPIDYEQSVEKGTTVYLTRESYSIQSPDYLRMDIGVSYRMNRLKSAHIFSLDIQNLTNRQNVYTQYYDPDTQALVMLYQFGLIPVLNYKIEF